MGLVFKRDPGEAFVLNGVIEIRVLQVQGKTVKLGVCAPPDVVVVREELLEGYRPKFIMKYTNLAECPCCREVEQRCRCFFDGDECLMHRHEPSSELEKGGLP